MSKQPVMVIGAEIVEERPVLSLTQLSEMCGIAPDMLVEYVRLGIIEPEEGGASVRRWRFRASALTRLYKAARLQRDLGVDASSMALVLDLLEDMERMRARMRRLEHLFGE